MSINRNHSRADCKNSLEMSILRGVFEGDINCDCIFTRFFEDPEAGGTTGKDPGSLKSINRNHSRTECKNSLEMSILRGVLKVTSIMTAFLQGFLQLLRLGEPRDRFQGNPGRP